MKKMVDRLTHTVEVLVNDIKADKDTHLIQQFYNSTTQCYILTVIGYYSLVYMKDSDQLVIAFRLEDNGTWGNGLYYSLDGGSHEIVTLVCKKFLNMALIRNLMDEIDDTFELQS